MAYPARKLADFSIMSFPPKTAWTGTNPIEGQFLTRVRFRRHLSRKLLTEWEWPCPPFAARSYATSSVPVLVVRGRLELRYVYTSGHGWVNGSHVPRSSSAIFSGDLLQTHSDSIANLNQSGSTVQVRSDSLVQFEGSLVKIDHGAVRVSTSKLMATTAGDVNVVPASSAWTEFNVTDVDGTVRISARKGDLTISDGKET